MPRPSRNRKGFSLIEAAVAIAVIAILASAAAPLVMKALNQQREQRTREDLKTAWEAMFGARDRRVANMRADFGFTPNAAITDLREMMTRPGTLRDWSADAALGNMAWGWNGPYWTGSTQTVAGVMIPVDGWGRPIRISIVNNRYQLRSLGADGRTNTADDLVYPPTAAPITTGSFSLTIKNETSTADLAGTYLVRYPLGNGSLSSSTPISFSGLKKPQSKNYTPTPPPGPVWVDVEITSVTPNISCTETLDLLPGQIKTLTYVF